MLLRQAACTTPKPMKAFSRFLPNGGTAERQLRCYESSVRKKAGERAGGKVKTTPTAGPPRQRDQASATRAGIAERKTPALRPPPPAPLTACTRRPRTHTPRPPPPATARL